MSAHEFSVEVILRIDANDVGEAAINRYVGLNAEQARALSTRPGLTRGEVLLALCSGVLQTGVQPHRLDGWADLSEGDLSVQIDYIGEGL